MSIDTSAKLIYGAPFEVLNVCVEGLEEMLDDGTIDYASPYYDAPRDEWIVGVELPKTFAGEAELVEALRAAESLFRELTEGLPGELIVSPHAM